MSPESTAPQAQGRASPSLGVFISHSGSDKPAVNRLRESLIRSGLRPWVSYVEIPVGGVYPERIVQAINNSDVVVLLVSKTSVASEHVYREVVEAASVSKPILPVFIDQDVPIPARLRYYLGTLHRVRYTPETVDQATPLIAASVKDSSAWARDAVAPGLLERIGATRARAWTTASAVSVAGGLTVWALQALWSRQSEVATEHMLNALPESLAVTEIGKAERARPDEGEPRGPWQLGMNVVLAGRNAAFSNVRILIHSSAGDAPDEVFDLTPILQKSQVGGGQVLRAELPHIGRRLVACITLDHPRLDNQRWRVVTPFGADAPAAQGGHERLDFRQIGPATTGVDEGEPCE